MSERDSKPNLCGRTKKKKVPKQNTVKAAIKL